MSSKIHESKDKLEVYKHNDLTDIKHERVCNMPAQN